jgi:hypothetical protein
MPKIKQPILRIVREQNEQGANKSLRDVVRESLLTILADPSASAAAKASAGRTLLEYFDAESVGAERRRGADMTAAELDEAINKLS